MRQTIYHPKYGYVSGNGLSDIFNFITKSIGSLPPPILAAGKKAAASVATQGITAAGDRIGSALPNRIAPKPVSRKAPAKTASVDSKKLLNDFKLIAEPSPTDNTADMYGFGTRRRIRGKGLKILK